MARGEGVRVSPGGVDQGGGFGVRVVPFDGALNGRAAEQAAAINRSMETLIASCPAQYFWSYNRYKKPGGVAGPDAPQADAGAGA